MPEIEHRPYGPDITEEEKALLRTQVTLFEGDVVLWKEAPVSTIPQLDIYAEKLDELTATHDRYYMLVDLTDTQRPRPEILNHLRKIMSQQTKLHHSALFTGGRLMLNIAAKFVLARIGVTSFSVHKSREEAVQAIHDVRD